MLSFRICVSSKQKMCPRYLDHLQNFCSIFQNFCIISANETRVFPQLAFLSARAELFRWSENQQWTSENGFLKKILKIECKGIQAGRRGAVDCLPTTEQMQIVCACHPGCISDTHRHTRNTHTNKQTHTHTRTHTQELCLIHAQR